jgi:tetratricopeptide (TPR) repeat protein
MRKLINKNQTQDVRTYYSDKNEAVIVHKEGICFSDDKEMDSTVEYFIKNLNFELAELQEQRQSLYSRWKTEKDVVDEVQNLKKEIEKILCSNELNNEIFSEVAASQLKHLFNNTGNFENKYNHTDLELLSDDLFNLLSKYIKTGAGAFLTLSASIELVKSYTKSPEYLVDLAIDMILVSLGEKIEFVENEKEAEEKEKINSLTYEIMELESQGLYEEAIGKINQQLILVEELNKKTFLIYDKMAVLNNKAYYLLLLKVYDEALDVINEAILEFDDAPEMYHTRAEIYLAIEKYNNALVDINKSIELAYEDSKEELKSEILKKI